MSTKPRLVRCDLVLVIFPFTDLSAQKLRPALIIGRVKSDDLILAFISSQVAMIDKHTDCLLEPSDREFAMTGLKVASVVRLNKLATLHRNLVRRRLGRIGPQSPKAIAQQLKYVLEL